MLISGQSRRAGPGEDAGGSGPRGSELPPAAPAGELVDDAFRDAEALREGQRPDEAVHRYADALLADPGHQPSLLALGATLSELRRWGDALRVYQRATRLFPEDAVALAGLREARSRLDEGGLHDAGQPQTHEARPLPAGLRAEFQPRPAERPILVMPPSTADGGRELSRARLNRLVRALGSAAFLMGGAIFLGLGLRRIDMFTAYAAALIAAAALAAAASAFFPGHWRLALKSALVGATLGSLAIILVAVVATVVR